MCKNQSIMHIGRCVLECDFWCDTDDDDDNDDTDADDDGDSSDDDGYDDDEGTFEFRWSV